MEIDGVKRKNFSKLRLYRERNNYFRRASGTFVCFRFRHMFCESVSIKFRVISSFVNFDPFGHFRWRKVIFPLSQLLIWDQCCHLAAETGSWFPLILYNYFQIIMIFWVLMNYSRVFNLFMNSKFALLWSLLVSKKIVMIKFWCWKDLLILNNYWNFWDFDLLIPIWNWTGKR